MDIDAVFQKSVACAVNAIGIVLGKNPVLSHDGAIRVERLVNREDLVINMGICNAEWQGILTFGASREDIARLVDDPSSELALDALGEVLNTTAGMVAEADETRSLFGELCQTSPVVLEGGTFYPKAQGVQADVLLDNSTIRFGFSMRAVGQ